jgi:hypothetical protein
MSSQNKPVQRLKAVILSLDLTCSGLVTHSGKFLITGTSRKKMPVHHSQKRVEKNVDFVRHIKQRFSIVMLAARLNVGFLNAARFT